MSWTISVVFLPAKAANDDDQGTKLAMQGLMMAMKAEPPHNGSKFEDLTALNENVTTVDKGEDVENQNITGIL